MTRGRLGWIGAAGMLLGCGSEDGPTGAERAPGGDSEVVAAVRIAVRGAPESLLPGDSVQLQATVYGPGGAALEGEAVRWSSVSPQVLGVSARGLVRAVAPGPGLVEAAVDDVADTVGIRVLPPVAAIRIVPGTLTLPVTAADTVEVVLLGAGGDTLPPRPVAWETGAGDIVGVDGDGVLHALGTGTAVVRAEREGRRDSVRVTVVADTAIAVSAGGMHSCALLASGRAFCWGGNRHGEVGDGTGRDRAFAVPVAGTRRFVAISAGGGFSCAIAQDRSGWCWGDNSMLELGGAGGKEHHAPVPVSGGWAFRAIGTSEMSHACGLTLDGKGVCWGYNRWGQVGNGSTLDSPLPTSVVGDASFREIESGYMRTCAVRTDGSAWCWGRGGHVQLGNDTTQLDACTGVLGCATSPRQVVTTLAFTAIATGRMHTCGLTAGGEAYCWGTNGDGRLGTGTADSAGRPAPLAGGFAFTAVTAGAEHTCGLTADGRAWCWGRNTDGRLGAGTVSAAELSPVAVTGGLRFTALSAGYQHTCGVTERGRVYCWGLNEMAQLGTGDTLARSEPAPVVGLQ